MIDHLVYVTADPEATAQLLGGALGAVPSPGGRHPDRGTVNQLLRIGPETYLEILSPDPAAGGVDRPRWMGVDGLPAGQSGRLSRWAWRVREGQRPVPPADQDDPFGPFVPGRRSLADGSLLEWQLTEPGAMPHVRARPFLIDWLDGPGPASRLPDRGCRLERLTVHCPEPELFSWLSASGIPLYYAYHPTVRLEAILVNDDGGKAILV